MVCVDVDVEVVGVNEQHVEAIADDGVDVEIEASADDVADDAVDVEIEDNVDNVADDEVDAKIEAGTDVGDNWIRISGETAVLCVIEATTGIDVAVRTRTIVVQNSLKAPTRVQWRARRPFQSTPQCVFRPDDRTWWYQRTVVPTHPPGAQVSSKGAQGFVQPPTNLSWIPTERTARGLIGDRRRRLISEYSPVGSLRSRNRRLISGAG